MRLVIRTWDGRTCSSHPSCGTQSITRRTWSHHSWRPWRTSSWSTWTSTSSTGLMPSSECSRVPHDALHMNLSFFLKKTKKQPYFYFPPSSRQGDVPFPRKEDGTLLYDNIDYKLTWSAMEKLVEKGLVRSIGLSNFNRRQIDDILSVASIKPTVLQVWRQFLVCVCGRTFSFVMPCGIWQVEGHPYLAQVELLAHCRDRGLVMTAYSPLGSPDRAWKHPDEPVLLQEPAIISLAEKYKKSPAQIILRWF